MGFGGEMDDGGGTMFAEELRDQGGVADVAVDERVERIGFEGGKVFGIAGVGELV